MRIFLTILLLISLQASATNYYISNAGSDAANGLTTGTSWQTIAKVNASSFSPGDQILFKTGDTWMEQLIISSSGSAGNLITISSYGTGLKPIITGLQPLTGFTNTSGNIWSATASGATNSLNNVIISGVISGKGRYPNTTYSSTVAYTTNRIVSEQPLLIDYTGGEIVVKSTPWISDVCKITSQSGDTVFFTPALSTSLSGRGYFFFQNLPSLLDLSNEWAYNSTTKLLSIYSLTNPTVKYSTIDTLVSSLNKTYVIFDGLNITGSNIEALRIDTCNHITIQNCTFNNNGRDAIYARKSDYTIVKKDSIINSLNNSIFLLRYGSNATVDSNYISKSGMLNGMGASGNVACVGIYNDGISATITNNTVDSIGYSAISFEGTNTLVKYNWIKNFMQVKADGGGIYSVGNTSTAGSVIRKNIVDNGGGAGSSGIYSDYSSSYITIDSNTVKDCTMAGFLFNSPNNLTVQYNTIVNGKGACFYYSIGGGGNHSFKNNIYYSTDSTQYVYFNYYTTLSGTVIDSNYYLRPVKENLKFRIQEQNSNYNLAGFQAITGYDLHSLQTPAGITSAPGILYYNPTLSNSNIYFNGFKVDAKGKQYTGSITLQPFTSAILFTSIFPITGRIKNLNFQ
jgi:hypothetical protein